MSANRGIWSDLQYVLLGGEEDASVSSSSAVSSTTKSFEHCLEDLDWLLAMQAPDLSVPDSD